MTVSPDVSRHLLTRDDQIVALLRSMKTIAVLGIKTEARPDQPAFYVPEYLHSVGLRVIPVPVYHPEATRILGQPVFRSLRDIPEPIDVVDVFRRPNDLMPHLDDILACHPRAVWLQSGIRHDEFARLLAENRIDVVQDRCLMVDHQMLL